MTLQINLVSTKIVFCILEVEKATIFLQYIWVYSTVLKIKKVVITTSTQIYKQQQKEIFNITRRNNFQKYDEYNKNIQRSK